MGMSWSNKRLLDLMKQCSGINRLDFNMRNSTQKFRQRYDASLSKDTLTHTQSTQLPNPLSKTISAFTSPNILKSSSSRKLESVRRPLSRTVQGFQLHPIEGREPPIQLRKEMSALLNRKGFDEQSMTSITSLRKTLLHRQANQIQSSTKDKEEERAEKFMQKLPKNSVFFCGSCCLYVFEIEKKRHFPDCKDVPTVTPKQTRAQIGWQRLEKILDLAKYTHTKVAEIEKLYEQMMQGEYPAEEGEMGQRQHVFLRLEDIREAMLWTWNRMLRGSDVKRENGFLNCF